MEEKNQSVQPASLSADHSELPSYLWDKPVFVENLVRRKTDKQIFLQKILMVLLAMLVFYLLLYVPVLDQYWIVSLLVCGLAASILWNYQNMEYEFSLTGPELDVVVIYGRRKRKDLVSLHCSEIQQLSPMRKAYRDTWGAKNNQIYFAASHLNSKTRWFALFTNKQGKRSILIFEPTEEMLTQMRRYVGSNYME